MSTSDQSAIESGKYLAWFLSECLDDDEAESGKSSISNDDAIQWTTEAAPEQKRLVNCEINKDSRNLCTKCRFELCLLVGMNPNLIRSVSQSPC